MNQPTPDYLSLLLAIAFLLMAVLLCAGCASTADALRSLKDDHSTLTVETVTPWGTQKITRSNPAPGGDALTSPNGDTKTTGGAAK